MKTNTTKGFTLVETLVAVLIIVILVTMAVPMYQRAIEKSRLAEVSLALKKIGESKLRIMDSKDIDTFNNNFTLNELDVQNPTNSDFIYSLNVSSSFPNAVCAKRARGENQGTLFLFLGETGAEACDCAGTTYNARSVCGGYCTEGRRLFCQSPTGTTACDNYGMDSYTSTTCGNTTINN